MRRRIVASSRLAGLVVDRPRLTLVTQGGRRITGALVGVGRDEVSVRVEGDASPIAYVPVASLRALLRSG
jgi:hypothetical protein